MKKLDTIYAGIELKNPVIVGACGFTSNLKMIQKIEEAGAGAIVIKTLYEEQINLEEVKFERDMHKFDNLYAEMVDIYPEIKHSGPEQHLMWVRKVKESVSIPVFASLNAVNKPVWVEYAKLLQDTGVDGIEVNLTSYLSHPDKSAEEVENEQLEIVKSIIEAVHIPVSVKLSPYYSSPMNFGKKMGALGVDGLVLFNHLFQPEIDVKDEKQVYPFNFTTENDHRLPLRFIGAFSGDIGPSLCANSGIYSSDDAIKMILAGADAVQVVGALYKNSVTYVKDIVRGIRDWMLEHDYPTLADFKGKLNKKHVHDSWAYRRTQYVKMLMKGEPLD